MKHEHTRRQVLARGVAAGAMPFVSAVERALAQAATEGAGGVDPAHAAWGQPVIVLRSGWQTVNIGDIAHTPGVLAVLRDYLPQVKVIAWLRHADRGVRPMIERAFPKVEIVEGTGDPGDRFDHADLLLHGSGPSVVAARDLDWWRKRTGKPYGTFGVTIGSVSDTLRDILDAASFVFCRETASIDVIRKAGVTKPTIGFAPDGTWFFDLRDEDKAAAYCKAAGLEDRKFICVIPRLRYTPYHKIREHKAGWSDEKIREVETTNAKFAEVDHAKLRAAMIRWVRETDLPVLVCPEMTYQLDVMDELLIDPLPDDVKKRVVKRDTYWLPDEAASVYKRAHTVISAECHSPIMSAAAGTPCFYVRQPTDTIKGQMYYDLGLTDWVFEIDQTEGAAIADRLMKVHADYPAAQAYLAKAMAKVGEQYRKTTAIVGRQAKVS